MAIEYKLPYTAFEIGDKLRTVDEVKTALENDYYTKSEISTSFEAVNESIGEVTASLKNKVDLVDGKIPLEKLPDDVSSNVDLSNYYTKPETDEALSLKADLVNGKVPLEQLPDDIGGGNTEVAWEDIKNKPFGETGIYVEMPSDISNCTIINSQTLEAIDMPFSYIKVSDTPLNSAEEIYGALAKGSANGANFEFVIEENHIQDLGNGFGVLILGNGFYPVLMNVTSAGTSTFPAASMLGEDMIFDVTETGVYFLCIEGMAQTASLEKQGEIKQIDSKFIPNIFVKSASVGKPNGVATLDNAGKIPVEQLPDNIGGNGGSGSGSLEQVQADFAQNDDTQVDYIKNRPFYDTRIRSYYSQAENPNPVSFDCAPIGYSFYKISDLVPTREEIFSTMKILALHDGVSDITPPESAILVETEDFIATNDGNWGFSFVNKPGVLNFTFSGYSLSINVSEAGIYYIRPLSSGIPEGRIFEIIVGGELKHIDPKYLPQGGVGYEKGEKILWDGKPTDTYIQPGQIIEWDGSDTGVSVPVPADEEMGRPEGILFYKVAEKLDSLLGWTFQTTNGSTISLNSEEIGTILDDSGNVIATYGSSDTMWVWNVEQTVPVNVVGADVTFPETGLYFINLEGQFRVECMYNIIYENLGETRLYKIAEPLNDDLNGYRMNVTVDGQSLDIIITDNPEGDDEAYYGSAETGSSYGLPYIFNIVTDNESIDCMDTFGAIFKFEKAGLYVIDVVAMGATFNFLAGRDYKVVKIDEKFLPEGMQLKSELRTWIDGSDDYYPTTGAVYRALGGREQLSIQTYVNSWSSDPVSSQAVFNALGGREQLSIDSYVSSYSDNPVSSKAVYEALQNIQIDVDSTVQSGSSNAVSGNAVYNAIQNSKTVADSVVSGISNNAVSGKAVYNQLQNYYTKSEIANDYYTKLQIYTKSEVDAALDNIDLSNHYTKSEVDALLGDIDTVLDEINALIGE